MEEAVAARLAALEFIVEAFIANMFADAPQTHVEAFAEGVTAKAYDGALGVRLEGQERLDAIRQAENIGDATVHRMARIVERTDQIRRARKSQGL